MIYFVILFPNSKLLKLISTNHVYENFVEKITKYKDK